MKNSYDKLRDVGMSRTPRQKALELRKKYKPRIEKAKRLRDKYTKEVYRLETELNDKIIKLF